MSEIEELRKNIGEQKALARKISFEQEPSNENVSQIKKLNTALPEILNRISLKQTFPKTQNISAPKKQVYSVREENYKKEEADLEKRREKYELDFSKETLKRIKRKETKKEIRKIKKPSGYVKLANNLFSENAKNISEKQAFRNLRRDLVQANLHILPSSYISIVILTTVLSFITGILLFLFFLFFNLGVELPIITLYEGSYLNRFAQIFWIMFLIPVATFFLMFFYPSLEKKSVETKINQELPFVAIHLSAVSGSLVEPSRIFKIIAATKEYPAIEKEFNKLLNRINVYGFNLVGALRESAYNCASKKLSEMFNGLATTITSGGDLQTFFEKRAQTLLFEYRLAREKYTRSAETFMDIYISVVIAAPMIFMLLLVIIKVSGLGLALSTSALTTLMILGVIVINIVFLSFLHLKHANE